MKAMCIDSSKNFVWQDVSEPVCHGEFDVKIAIKACAVNRADLMHRQGIYAPPEGWVCRARRSAGGNGHADAEVSFQLDFSKQGNVDAAHWNLHSDGDQGCVKAEG